MFGLSLDVIFTWINVAYLISLAFTVFLSAALWRVATISQADKDRQLEVYKQNSAVKIAEANVKSEQANSRAAEATARTIELQIALDREIAKQQPRSLSEEQNTALVQSLKTVPKGKMIIRGNMFDTESTRFAVQIKIAFEKGGFDVGEALGVLAIEAPGIIIIIKNKNAAPEHLNSVVLLLRHIGLSVSLHVEDYVPDEQTVVIFVGRKPP